MAGFISLADAKAQLRVIESDEDGLIQRLIDAASSWIEEQTGHVAEERAGESFAFDRFDCELELRLRPIEQETIAVSYLDGEGEEQEFEDFRVVERFGTSRILPAIGGSWPAAHDGPGAVTVTATAGYGATAEAGAADAPEDIKHAARLLVAHWFANREAVNVGNIVTELPLAVEALVRPHRLRRV